MTAEEFKSIFLPCHKQLYLLAFRLTGKREEAEDLVQETYLKIWNNRDRLSGVSSPSGFCLATLKNLFFDTIRHKTVETVRIDDSPPIRAKSTRETEREIESNDTVSNLMRIIDTLPSSQREVIRLKDVSEFTVEEIEQATGLSPGNIRTLLCRARKTIKQQYLQLINYERK